MFHYILINQLNPNPKSFFSSRNVNFWGYESAEKAYMHGLAAKINNNLSDFYVIFVYKYKF